MAGDIVLGKMVYQEVSDRYPHLEQVPTSVRGRDKTNSVRTITPKTLKL